MWRLHPLPSVRYLPKPSAEGERNHAKTPKRQQRKENPQLAGHLPQLRQDTREGVVEQDAEQPGRKGVQALRDSLKNSGKPPLLVL